jgi:hypothetical protein
LLFLLDTAIQDERCLISAASDILGVCTMRQPPKALFGSMFRFALHLSPALNTAQRNNGLSACINAHHVPLHNPPLHIYQSPQSTSGVSRSLWVQHICMPPPCHKRPFSSYASVSVQRTQDATGRGGHSTHVQDCGFREIGRRTWPPLHQSIKKSRRWLSWLLL